MTMHMLPVYYTTTNHKKRKKKNTSKQNETDAKHAKFLKKMGYSGKGSNYRSEMPDYKSPIKVAPTSDMIATNTSTAKKEPNVYSGKRKLLGVATMHKSNMVPVFSNEDAEAISKMRR